jgi:hypothetical protein
MNKKLLLAEWLRLSNILCFALQNRRRLRCEADLADFKILSLKLLYHTFIKSIIGSS